MFCKILRAYCEVFISENDTETEGRYFVGALRDLLLKWVSELYKLTSKESIIKGYKAFNELYKSLLQ